MIGYTPTLTPNVTVEEFRAVVYARGEQRAAEIIGVTEGTVQRWMIGYGTPQPSKFSKIERFVRYSDYAEIAQEYTQ